MRPGAWRATRANGFAPSFSDAQNETFESWVVGHFGRRLFEMFFKSYSEKLWGIPCHRLDADFAAQRIKKFSLGEAIKSAFGLGGGKAQDARGPVCFSDRRHRHGLRANGPSRRRARRLGLVCTRRSGVSSITTSKSPAWN